ncbi:MAG: hypothetical protein V2A61_08010, partial [Calditrichota bacterium]
NPHTVMVLISALNIHTHIFSPMIRQVCLHLNEEQFLQQHNDAIMDLLEYGLFADRVSATVDAAQTVS